MDTVRARVLPLEGKHYGTNIVIENRYEWEATINVWIAKGDPSAEQLAEWGLTRQQWDDNEPIEDSFWGITEGCRSVFMTDSHYQSEIESRIAHRIEWALDGWTP